MNKKILLLVLVMCFGVSMFAQFADDNEFVINTPLNISGSYDFGEQVDWGPLNPVTVCADFAWGYTANGDSVGCDPIVTDLTGKIAMISRGACNFSLKAYHAQQAGAVGTVIINYAANDPAEIVNMLGGDSMTVVTTPAAFLPYGTGSLISNEVDAGNTVNGCFKIPVISGPQGIYHYSTPYTQIVPLDSFWLTVHNNGSSDETNVTLNITVTDPAGNNQSFSNNGGTIVAGAEAQIAVAGPYTPVLQGTYNVSYNVSSDAGTYAADSVDQEFEITNDVFANDNKNQSISGRVVGGFDASLRYDVGNFYYTSSAAIATHASFGITNVEAMHGETFDVILYDVDKDLDGNFDMTYPGGDYLDIDPPVGFSSVTIDSTIHNSGDTIMVEILPLVLAANELAADGAYLIVVQYNAINSSVGNLTPPAYLHSSPQGYRFVNTMVYTDNLNGWTDNANALVRLHTDPFTGTEDVKVLELGDVEVFPNPSSDFVTLKVDFEEAAKDMNVKIYDINGRLIQDVNYQNVQNQQFTFDVSDFVRGNYFIRVQTENGFRTKHFLKMD